MTKNKEIEQALLRYASGKSNLRDNKYLPLIELIRKLSIRKELESSETKCLIIGGGSCQHELPLIQAITENAEITSLDSVRPAKFPTLNLKWIEGSAPESLMLLPEETFDVIICLGTTRYFTDINFTLETICKKAKTESIIIFDIMQLPPMKTEINCVLRDYLFNSVDYFEALSKLKQLSKFFCNLSKSLNSQHALNEVAIPELGIESGVPFQQVIFDALCPIYFKEYEESEEIEVMTLWQILCNGTLPLDFDISNLAQACNFNVASEIRLNTNTTAYISVKSNTDREKSALNFKTRSHRR
jgi:ubiquinone/menaquinone biosynthesis C-methylase UbiE